MLHRDLCTGASPPEAAGMMPAAQPRASAACASPSRGRATTPAC